MSRSTGHTKRELWQAHLLYASGQDDQERLQKAVDDLGIKAPRAQAPRLKLRGEDEGSIQSAVIEMMVLHPRVVWVERSNSGGRQWTDAKGKQHWMWFYQLFARFLRLAGLKQPFTSGKADLTFMLRGGRFGAFEVKAPGEKPTEAQQAYLDMVIDGGGIGAVVQSMDEAAAVLKEAWSE